MLKYALLPYLFLLAEVHCGIQQEFMDSYFLSPVPIPAKYAIAPEPSRDNHSFAVAHLAENLAVGSQLHLYILDDRDVGESKGCAFGVVSANEGERWFVSDLHRLTNDKLVVTIHGENVFDEIDHLYSVAVADMGRCRLKDLPEFEMTYERPIVVPSYDETFEVISNDPRVCGAEAGGCRVSYNLKNGYEGRMRAFDVNFNWTTMEVKRLAGGDLLVQGRDGDGTFKVVWMHPESSHGKPLIGRIDGQPNMQFVSSSDLSFCWNVDPSSSFTFHCAQYDLTTQNYSLWQEVNLYEEVQLLHVRSIGKGEVVVVARQRYCDEESDDCWALLVTKVRQGRKETKWMAAMFPCSGEQSKLVIFGAEKVEGTESVRFRYACRDGNGYSFIDIEV